MPGPKYHKINSIFKRDENTGKFLDGQFSSPEIEFLVKNPWEFTEKVDGTNIRIAIQPDFTVKYGGRTDNAQLQATLIDAMNEMFPQSIIEEVFKESQKDGQEFPEITLYGEGYGPKIQKGGENYRNTQSFVLFDVRIGTWWLTRESVNDIAAQLDIEAVPVIGTGNLYDAIEMCLEGFNSQWGDFEAEGIVARPKVDLFTRSGQRVITKVKCRDYKKLG